jgi:hypothetical protein
MWLFYHMTGMNQIGVDFDVPAGHQVLLVKHECN